MATEQRSAPIDRKRLRSQRLREVNFQGDALRLGMNWTEDDLRKPQVLVESAYRALSQGWIAGAGLDDIEEEPAKIRDWRPDIPLFELDNQPALSPVNADDLKEARWSRPRS